LERLTPADLESPESRERFLAGLPPWLFGTVGGNSPCVSVQFDNVNELIIFDAGSGIRELGLAVSKEKVKPSQYHIFFSHFHWDHIMGLPFFNPAYDPSVKVNFYSPLASMETALGAQMISPYFPIQMESMPSKRNYYTMSAPLNLMGVSVSYRKLKHPGDSYSFKLDDGKHKFIYATDTELSADDFIKNDENSSYFSEADVIVIDAQYTLGEAIEKYNWGHSAFSLAVDFAANWNIKHVVFFHHDPAYDDNKLFTNLQSAKGYTERLNLKGIKLSLALEGTEICL
jgi:phosphoribosyl 1,2-cyclic phosphodiesterase